MISGNPRLLVQRAMGTVISIVILAAVTIIGAVVISTWMTGIISLETKFEKVEIQTAYTLRDSSYGWKVIMIAKNTGTADVKLTGLYISDVPLNATGYGATDFPPDASGDLVVTSIGTSGTTLASGEQTTIYVWIYNGGIDGYAKLSSGTTINIKLHSAGGMDYIKLVEPV